MITGYIGSIFVLLIIHFLAELLSDDCLELLSISGEAPDAGAELIHGHLVHIVQPAEAGLVKVEQGVSRGVSTSHALYLHSLAIIRKRVKTF